MITDTYREQNQQLHTGNKEYGAHGGRWAPVVMQLCAENMTQDVLDYGCGKASLHMQMPFGISNYDPSVPKYATPPEPAEVLVCCDVMEHVEPEYTDKVLDDLQALMKTVGLINIATRLAKKTLPDGRNAHLVVETGQWWYEKLKERFEIRSCNMDDNEITVLVAKK